jgi:hypothetical protein
MSLKKSTTTKSSPPKGTAPTEEEVKEVVKHAPPKTSSLKEAYPTIESLKNALRKGDEAQKNQIAKLANTDSTDIHTILTIWKNA